MAVPHLMHRWLHFLCACQANAPPVSADCVDVQSETHTEHTQKTYVGFSYNTLDHMESKCMNFNADKHELDECNHSRGSERVNSRFSLHVCAHVWRVLAGNLSSSMKHVQKETHNVLNEPSGYSLAQTPVSMKFIFFIKIQIGAEKV